MTVTSIVVDQAETDFLDLIVAVAYTVRLYQGDMVGGVTPADLEAYDASDFTEASFPGYAAVAVAGGAWTVTAGDPSVAVTTSPAVFTQSTGATAQNVHGYYVTRTSDGVLQWFHQFDGPVVFEFASDQLSVSPSLTLDDKGGAGMDTGVIVEFGGAVADVPPGALPCDGAAVSRTTYAALFAVIGTTFGAGDGSTTFNVPNFGGRFALGKSGSGTGSTLGGTGGSIDHTHNLDTPGAVAKVHVQTAPANFIQVERVINQSWPGWTSNYAATVTSTGASAGAGITAGAKLRGDTASANPPFLVVNKIIYT